MERFSTLAVVEPKGFSTDQVAECQGSPSIARQISSPDSDMAGRRSSWPKNEKTIGIGNREQEAAERELFAERRDVGAPPEPRAGPVGQRADDRIRRHVGEAGEHQHGAHQREIDVHLAVDRGDVDGERQSDDGQRRADGAVQAKAGVVEVRR